jgi:hypothetical protein
MAAILFSAPLPVDHSHPGALKELRQTVAVLKVNIESPEKRELLRVWGKANCRLYHPNYSEPNPPPISEWEQKFHDANHATGSPPKSFECFRPSTRNWEEVRLRRKAILYSGRGVNTNAIIADIEHGSADSRDGMHGDQGAAA